MEEITLEQIRDLLDPDPAFRKHALELFQAWLQRGDGVAVYANVEIGHPNAGHLKFVSYGSEAAMLENCDEPPSRMPDIGGDINWRYRLKAVCRRG